MDGELRQYIRAEFDRLARERVRRVAGHDPIPVGCWIRCESCSKWFKKRNMRQRFCRPNCRKLRGESRMVGSQRSVGKAWWESDGRAG